MIHCRCSHLIEDPYTTSEPCYIVLSSCLVCLLTLTNLLYPIHLTLWNRYKQLIYYTIVKALSRLLHIHLSIRTALTFRRLDWQPLLHKIDRLLAISKGSCLSWGGRFTLLNSVLSDLSLYCIPYFHLSQ